MTDTTPGQNDKWTCGCLRYQDVLALAPDALTYRQLNHWTVTLGIVPASFHTQSGVHLTAQDAAERDKPIGSGHILGWSMDDARIAARAAQIIAATSTRSSGFSGGGAHVPLDLALRLAAGPVMLTLGDDTYCLRLEPLVTQSVSGFVQHLGTTPVDEPGAAGAP